MAYKDPLEGVQSEPFAPVQCIYKSRLSVFYAGHFAGLSWYVIKS